jgi:membrane protein DedA with SNARE-associated domain
METIFLHYLESWSLLVYALIFLGMFIEGDVILFLSFYLANQGELNLFVLIAVTLVGVFLGDMCWYKFGIYPEKWFPFLKKRIEKISAILDDQLQKNLFRTVLISKFTYNLHHITLMRVGALQIPFKKYLKTDILSSIIWIISIGGLGYVSSLSFSLFKKYLKFAEIGLLISLIVFFVLIKLFSRYAKK